MKLKHFPLTAISWNKGWFHVFFHSFHLPFLCILFKYLFLFLSFFWDLFIDRPSSHLSMESLEVLWLLNVSAFLFLLFFSPDNSSIPSFPCTNGQRLHYVHSSCKSLLYTYSWNPLIRRLIYTFLVLECRSLVSTLLVCSFHHTQKQEIHKLTRDLVPLNRLQLASLTLSCQNRLTPYTSLWIKCWIVCFGFYDLCHFPLLKPSNDSALIPT